MAEFKNLFYPRGWAHYEKARIGTLMLTPAKHSIEVLRKDYERMQSMIYGKAPTFDELMEEVKQAEVVINNCVNTDTNNQRHL